MEADGGVSQVIRRGRGRKVPYNHTEDLPRRVLGPASPQNPDTLRRRSLRGLTAETTTVNRNGDPTGSLMTATPRERGDALVGDIGPRVARNNRIGWILIVVGVVALAAVLVWGFLLNGSSSSGSQGLVYDAGGGGAFALILAGLVLFGESRSFMRKNKGLL